MFNPYEMEQLGKARRAQLRDNAARFHQINDLTSDRQSLWVRLVVTCGDLCIALGYRLKSWYTDEGVSIRQYQLDIQDITR